MTHEAPTRRTLFHYTTQRGLEGILLSQKLLASLAANNPADVRFGNGQYLSNLEPGAKTPAQLSRALLGQPFQGRRFTHYLEIDITGLMVVHGRGNIFVIPNDTALDLVGRIVRSGKVE
jgi:HYD1 signature containing ADP-ribosyltransferase